jgi:hypothetical protein
MTPDDPRLTEEFCQAFADGMYQVETDTIGMSEDTQIDADAALDEEFADKLTGA